MSSATRGSCVGAAPPKASAVGQLQLFNSWTVSQYTLPFCTTNSTSNSSRQALLGHLSTPAHLSVRNASFCYTPDPRIGQPAHRLQPRRSLHHGSSTRTAIASLLQPAHNNNFLAHLARPRDTTPCPGLLLRGPGPPAGSHQRRRRRDGALRHGGGRVRLGAVPIQPAVHIQVGAQGSTTGVDTAVAAQNGPYGTPGRPVQRQLFRTAA